MKRGPKPGKTGAQRKKQPIKYSGDYSLPPRGMTAPAKRIWTAIVADFPPGYHQPKHWPLLEIFCESFANWSKGRSELAKQGLVVVNEKSGAIKPHPLIGIINAEVQKMNQLAPKLSLVVPSDRPDSDVSFKTETKAPAAPELAAFEKLKSREAQLRGAELTLFKKLKEKYDGIDESGT